LGPSAKCLKEGNSFKGGDKIGLWRPQSQKSLSHRIAKAEEEFSLGADVFNGRETGMKETTKRGLPDLKEKKKG